MNLDSIVSAAGVILALIVSLWRMHAMQTRRIDQLQRELISRTDQLRSDSTAQSDQVRAELTELRVDLTAQNRGLAESIAKLDSRLSRVEGMLQPRPWVEVPHESAGVPG